MEKVSELIWPGTRSWNIGRINRVFSRYDAAKIVKIPLIAYQGCDNIIWKDNRDGQYSVKSSYKEIKSNSSGQQPIGPSQSNAVKCMDQSCGKKYGQSKLYQGAMS